MHILYMIFIALANNLDNISVRIAYSVRGIKISTAKNLYISLITFCIATFAALFGSSLSTFFSAKLSSIISMLLLWGIGIMIIREQLIDGKNSNGKTDKKSVFNILKKPEIADMDNSKEIDFKEAVILGIALSLDNVGGGFSAGMMGLNIFFMGFLSALVSFLALWSGNHISAFLVRYGLNKKAGILSGVILLAIGFKQIL